MVQEIYNLCADLNKKYLLKIKQSINAEGHYVGFLEETNLVMW